MAPAAIAFWRETSITVILLLTTANICRCGDDVLDVERSTMPEITSQMIFTTEKTPHKSNKYSSAKDEGPDNIKQLTPRWKYPQKMLSMESKPVGSSVRLKCSVEGNPTPNITWQKNGGPVVRSYFQPSYSKWSMKLDELTKTDDGNYTCIACNVMGCINHTLTLNVLERLYAKPLLTRGADNLTVLVGETAQFSCEFLSDLHPYIYWMFFSKDEKNYGDDSEYEMNYFLPDFKIVSENSTDKPEQLTLFNVTKEKEGWYVCMAINALGGSTAKGYLTVLESLPEKEPFDHGIHTLLIIILTAVLGAMFFVAAIIVVMILKKLKKEKRSRLRSSWR